MNKVCGPVNMVRSEPHQELRSEFSTKTAYVTLVIASLVFALISCQKSSPVNGGGEVIPSEKPQVNIPWPSLANSPWPMYLHDPQHTGRSQYRGPQQGKVEWMFETGNSVYSSPAIASDGTICFGSHDGFFYAVWPDGSLKWKLATDLSLVQSSPLISLDGTIFFSAWDGSKTQLYAVSQDGHLRWKLTSIGGEWPLLISRDGQTIYASDANTTFALGSQDGEKKWELSLNSAYVSAISPDGSTIYLGVYGNSLYAVGAGGTIKWKFGLAGPPSTPCVDNDGNVYLNAGNYCYSIDPNGNSRWKCSTGGVYPSSSPAIGEDGTLYTLGGGGSKLLALNYAGKLKWEIDLASSSGLRFGKTSQNSPIIDSEGTVYLGTLTTRVQGDTINFLAIASTGTFKWAISLRSPPEPGVPDSLRYPDIDSKPAIGIGGHIYVGSDRPRGFHLYDIN